MFEQLSNVGPFQYKFHQVAIYTPRIRSAIDQWVDLGFDVWHEDTATLNGKYWDGRNWIDVTTEAEMRFNYDILGNGLELELIKYNGSMHTLKTRGMDSGDAFISHISVYTEDLAHDRSKIEEQWGLLPFHVFTTDNHSNPRVKGKKKFTETIYKTSVLFGYDIKLIQKVDPDFVPDYSEFV